MPDEVGGGVVLGSLERKALILPAPVAAVISREISYGLFPEALVQGLGLPLAFPWGVGRASVASATLFR